MKPIIDFPTMSALLISLKDYQKDYTLYLEDNWQPHMPVSIYKTKTAQYLKLAQNYPYSIELSLIFNSFFEAYQNILITKGGFNFSKMSELIFYYAKNKTHMYPQESLLNLISINRKNEENQKIEAKKIEEQTAKLDKSIPIPFLNNKRIYFEGDGVEDEKDNEYEVAIKNFIHNDQSVLTNASPHLYAYYLDYREYCTEEEGDVINLDNIWDFVQFSDTAMTTSEGDEVYISVEWECVWEPEHGLQVVFKNGNEITRLGPYDGHITNEDPQQIYDQLE